MGKVENKQLVLSEIGKIVHEEWLNTPNYWRNFNLNIDKLVVMPNYIDSMVSYSLKNEDLKPEDGGFTPEERLESIIGEFMIKVRKQAQQLNPEFAWEREFLNRIVKSPHGFFLTRSIIENSVGRWEEKQLKS